MKKCALFLSVMSIVVCGLNASAESISLPCRYIETTYDVHTLTGTKSNEKTKETLKQRSVEITKYIVDGAAEIKFTAKSRRGIDKSSDEVGKTAFEKKADLVSALKGISKKQNDQRMQNHPSDSSEKTYDDGDITLRIIATGREAFGEFIIGDAIFVLRERIDIDGLCRIISNLK